MQCLWAVCKSQLLKAVAFPDFQLMRIHKAGKLVGKAPDS